MTKYKQKAVELTKHRTKLVVDLVEFAVEWKKLKPELSVTSAGMGTYILLDDMATLIISTYTKPKEDDAKKT